MDKNRSMEDGPWKRNGTSWVSYLNFLPEMRSSLELPRKVLFHDVTLRDGEQTPGVVFSKSDKVQIARKLDEVGVPRIEAGFPVVSAEDGAAIKAIAKLGLKAKVFALSRAMKEDVDKAIDCDVSGVVIECSTSYVHRKYRFGWSKDDITNRTIETASYAKKHGLYVDFMSVDSTRTEVDFLVGLLKKLVRESHLDSATLTDSYCGTTPAAYAHLVRMVKKEVKIPIEAHTHNELGLAVANALAAVGAGAEVIHSSVNGIGEKTGNASFEEVAMAIHLLYGLNLGIKYEKLKELSSMVERRSGFKIALNKPIVGDYAFARESGLAISSWMRYHLNLQSFEPELVGNRVRIVLGKKSGRDSVKYKLGEMGMTAGRDLEAKILTEVKAQSARKKGPISDAEFKQIVRLVKQKK